MENHRHLERLREEEKKLHKQKKSATRKAILVIVVFIGVIYLIKTLSGTYPAEGLSIPAFLSKDQVSSVDDSWELLLVGAENPLPREFLVKLEEFGGHRVDARIVPQIENMFLAAKKEGIDLRICSGYRGIQKQTISYNSKIEEYLHSGYSQEHSKQLAGKYIQPPGASEHHTGLAIDIVTVSYQRLDEGFADTNAGKWLAANAADYGFILRYPKDKEDITGIAYEPWHYRYVGSYAKEITKSGLCLEEYVEKRGLNSESN